MLAPSKVNKENFRLLDLSSGEESEDLQLEIIPSRKKKVTRRERNRSIVHPHISEPNFGAEVQCALRWAVRGTLLLWLFMLTWICAALYDQVSTMQTGFLQVSRSNKAVDDVLQACHTTAKELRVNTSVLTARLEELKYNYTLLASRVDKATEELSAVSEQLSAAPKLADMPRTIADLQRLVADLGSQITGVDSSIQLNNRQAHLAVTGVEEVKTLLHQLEARTNDTIDNVTATIKRDDDLRTEIATLNSTFTAQVEALQNRIQEISKPATTPAPVSSTPVVITPSTTIANNATSANTTTSTTTIAAPVKPAVLQSEKSP